MEFDSKLRVLKFKTQKAFTLIEVLVVVSIIIILSVMIIPNYRTGEKELALQRSAHKLAQDIKRAQGMATSTKEYGGLIPAGGYGIYIHKPEDDKYIIYADSGSEEYEETNDEIVETIYLEEVVKIDSTNPSSTHFSINFKPPDPTVNLKAGGTGSEAEVTITLALRADSAIITILVNKAGLIEVTK